MARLRSKLGRSSTKALVLLLEKTKESTGRKGCSAGRDCQDFNNQILLFIIIIIIIIGSIIIVVVLCYYYLFSSKDSDKDVSDSLNGILVYPATTHAPGKTG